MIGAIRVLVVRDPMKTRRVLGVQEISLSDANELLILMSTRDANLCVEEVSVP